VRVWVPGCSTGEEVYSIAICLLELMGDIGTNPSIQIFATDVSDQAIQYAREGRYLENISMDVSPERLRRFFVRVDGGYQVSKTIRDVCIFARQNMTSDPPFSKLDLISCRNVLIYLDSKLQKRVIPLFHYALKPTGYLVLGTSETVGTFTDLFHPLDKHHKVYSKRAPSFRTPLDFSTVYPVEQLNVRHGSPELLQDENWRIQDAQRDADRVILTRFSAAGAVINHDMEIIQFRGDTSPFLEHSPGQPSLNILKMARNGISLELRAMIQEVKTAGTAVKKSVVINEGENLRTLKIDVEPLEVPNAKGSYFLILFEDDIARTEKLPEQPTGTSPVNPLQRRYDQLSAELSATKQHLQSIIEEHESTNEELQSAHEEVLSSNEELQSINEELETAKEELQSTNEELITVNEELQNRNTELSLLNNDLTNLLSSVNIPIVMLGSDLRIRRFTPLAEKLLSLIATDVGRPISDIKPRINVPDLETMVAEVMDTMSTKEVEVQDKEGRWYSMKIRPYRTRENKIEGAVIALFDIDIMRKHINEAEQFEDVVDTIIQTVRDPVLVLDFDFKVKKANSAFEDMFKTRVLSVKGASIYKIADGQFDSPALRKLLESVSEDKSEIKSGVVAHTLGNKKLSLSVRQVASEILPLRSIVVAINPA
jgi:two-component system, chemotaxis family, CheB/CheR fusion protein